MTLHTSILSLLLAGALGTAMSGSAAAEPLMEDTFDGNGLAAHWEVLNEDPDAYIVEDGKLLMIAAGGAHLKKGAVPNVFRLKGDLPKGDWVATIKFSMPYQTGREAPFLAIFEDQDNQIVTTANSWSYYEGTRGARSYLSTWKRVGGKESSFQRVIWGGAKGVAFDETQAPNPILLRISKKGRTYTPGYKLEGMNQTDWIEGRSVTVLKPKGGLSFGIFQLENVKGETPMSVDWFKVEALD